MTSDHKCFKYAVSAPGKVILFGEHSVVYKKAAVSTAIGRRLKVIISTTQGDTIHIKLPHISTEVSWNLADFESVVKRPCPFQNLGSMFTVDKPDMIDYDKYVASLRMDLDHLNKSTLNSSEKSVAALIGVLFVTRGMCHKLSCNLVPFSMEILSDLEVGAGTGSSAAFSVAIAGSIFHLRKCLDPNLTLEFCEDHEKSKFSQREMDIINRWAFCIEKIMHGKPSGIDNTTCTFGSVVVTEQENKSGGMSFRFLKDIPKISILLVSTGVSRNTSNLVAKVRQLRDINCAAVDAILNAMDVIAQEAVKILSALGANDTASVELFQILSSLMELNHGLLRTLGVSHDILEHIVSISNRHKLSSKLTGAGGGGYAITLIPPDFSRNKLVALKKELAPLTVTEINIAEEGIRLENLI